jgi:hypothetical protein
MYVTTYIFVIVVNDNFVKRSRYPVAVAPSKQTLRIFHEILPFECSVHNFSLKHLIPTSFPFFH